MKKIVAILSLVFLFSCEPSNKPTETHSESKTLSPTAEAIREYKETFQWEKVLSPGQKYQQQKIILVSPSLGLEATAEEIEEIVFGFVKETELKQELVDIIEHGNYITCFLTITTKTGEVMDVVEVFLVDEEGKVTNIWAL